MPVQALKGFLLPVALIATVGVRGPLRLHRRGEHVVPKRYRARRLGHDRSTALSSMRRGKPSAPHLPAWRLVPGSASRAASRLACGACSLSLMRLSTEALRPIPSVALIPLALLIYGFGYRMEIAVVAFACFWPLLIITESAVRGIEPQLLEVSRALGFGLMARVFKIVLPAVLPRVFVGLRLAAAVSLVVAVTVEITANPIGLGYALIVAQESMKPDRMFVFLVWIGFLGWLVNAVLLRAQRRWFGRMGSWAEQPR